MDTRLPRFLGGCPLVRKAEPGRLRDTSGCPPMSSGAPSPSFFASAAISFGLDDNVLTSESTSPSAVSGAAPASVPDPPPVAFAPLTPSLLSAAALARLCRPASLSAFTWAARASAIRLALVA